MRGDVRNVYVGDEVREKAIKGAKKVYEAVAAAYGPTSGNVALEKSYGPIVISHDGVSIARDIVLKDKLEDIGADLLIQASKRSNDVAGDGTTGSILLGYHIMEKANRRIAAGYNPMGIRRGIDKAAIWVKEEIDKVSKPVKDDALAEVAAVSASDPEVGKLVADIVNEVGGVGITIEEFEGLGVRQDVKEGLYFEKGYFHPSFVTDREANEIVHTNANIFCVEKRLSAQQDIVPLLELIEKNCDDKQVVIIGDVVSQALDVCVGTNIAGGIKIVVVNAPVYGDQMGPFLEDVAILTGGQVITDRMPISSVTADFIGEADKVVVTANETTIFGGKGDKASVKKRIQIIKDQLKDDKYTAFQKERMELRLSKLQGKIGIIKVGGATPTETKEMKFRVEDALHATKAAKESGVVPGGATTLARISNRGKRFTIVKKPAVGRSTDPDESYTTDVVEDLPRDEAEGFKVVLEALSEPFKQLMENAGEDGGYRIEQLKKSKAGQGFNVSDMTEEPIDLAKAGIQDPTKVIKSEVENACSVAGVAITLGAAVMIDRDFQLEQVQINKANQ